MALKWIHLGAFIVLSFCVYAKSMPVYAQCSLERDKVKLSYFLKIKMESDNFLKIIKNIEKKHKLIIDHGYNKRNNISNTGKARKYINRNCIDIFYSIRFFVVDKNYKMKISVIYNDELIDNNKCINENYFINADNNFENLDESFFYSINRIRWIKDKRIECIKLEIDK